MEVPIPKYFLLAATALAAASPLHAQVKPGEPPVTPLTQQSGGPVSPERAALHLEHADLAIEVFPETQRIAGVATLRLRTQATQSELLIDLDRNLAATAVALNGRVLPRRAWSNAEGRMAVRLPHALRAGQIAVLRIVYGGTPHVAIRAPWDDGFVWSRTPGQRQPWIASTTEGSGCDLLWPCLDFPAGEPDLVDLHITVPKGLKAPANGLLQRVDTLADGRTTWHWRARSPNPYSVAISVAPYAELSATYSSRFGPKIPMSYWYLPGRDEKARALFAEFAPSLDFFEAMIGPYPWFDEKVGVVETPHLGMEHQTINAYGNEYKKTPSGFDEIFQHELAHEWFGNQMSAANWDDYWLHEGFGLYMQPAYGLWREGEARYATLMDDYRVQISNLAPMVSGRIKTEEEVYDEDKGGPGQDIYYKGAWVLHTLRGLIGDKAFWEATRRLVYGRPDPRPGNFQPRFATTPEFTAIVDQVSGRDLGWFFKVYLYSAALPKLIETRSGGRLELRWQTPGDAPFPMPVEVRIDGRTSTVSMSGNKGSIPLPAGAHVVIDPHARVLRQSDAVDAYRAYLQKAGG